MEILRDIHFLNNLKKKEKKVKREIVNLAKQENIS